jgi:predicted N-acyltransferase
MKRVVAGEPPNAGAISVEVIDSIDRIDPAEWNGLPGPDDELQTHRFNRVVESAGVENAVLRYALVRQSGELVAAATLAIFHIDLGLFLGKGAEAWLARLRRVFPQFLKIRILICGLPASFGQGNIALGPAADGPAVLAALCRTMQELARRNRVRYLSFKEFDRVQADDLCALRHHGYFRAPSLPDTYLNLRPWHDFDDYFQAFRHPYRRKIALSLRKLGLERPTIDRYSTEKAAGPRPVLLYGGRDVCSPERFYALYLCVMARAETKLETLNLAFFEELYHAYTDELVVLALYRAGEVLGAALLLPAGDTLLFLLVGQEQARDDETDTYFNLVYAIVEYAFRHGFKAVKTGQTAYPFKLRIGAKPRELFLYFRAENRFKHALLRRFRAVVFPETRLARHRLWKEPGQTSV